MDTNEPFEETPQGTAFILNLPDNTTDACREVEAIFQLKSVKDLLLGEVVAAIKMGLNLPEEPYDTGATTEIINAVDRTMELCGFPSPEIIFRQLQSRKEALMASKVD